MAELAPTSTEVFEGEVTAGQTQFWAQFATRAPGVASQNGDDDDTYDSTEQGVTDYGTC